MDKIMGKIVFEYLEDDKQMEDEDEPLCSTCDLEETACQCCGDCGEYPCCCCGECGYAECECCGECEAYPCTCNDGHGTSEIAPWTHRGCEIERKRHVTSKWSDIWPEIDRDIDPIIAACDFYLLEAFTSNSIFNFKPTDSPVLTKEQESDLLDLLGIFELKDRKAFLKERAKRVQEIMESSPEAKLSGLMKKAETLQADLINKLDESFTAYVHVAVAGEIRHHKAIGGTHLDSERDVAWSGWRDIYESVGNQALLDVAELFEEFENDAYGGPKWADAAKILHLRLEGSLGPNDLVNKKLFVDRVFSMQHNGGQLLNKIEWKIKNIKKANVSYLATVLNHHASEPPDILFLYRVASKEVQDVILEAFKIGIPLRPEFSMSNSELVKAVTADPFFVCRQCGSDAKRGHYLSCKYAKYLKGSIVHKDGVPVFNNEYFQMRWEAADLPVDFFTRQVFIGPLGEPLIEPNQYLDVDVLGHASTFSGKSIKIANRYQIKAGELDKLLFSEYGYDRQAHGEITSFSINYTISVAGIDPLENYRSGRFYETWNADYYVNKLDFDGFNRKFVKPTMVDAMVFDDSKIDAHLHTKIEGQKSLYGPSYADTLKWIATVKDFEIDYVKYMNHTIDNHEKSLIKSNYG